MRNGKKDGAISRFMKHIRLQTDVDVNMSEYLLQVNKQYNALRIGNKPKEKRERSTWLLVRGWGTRARSIPYKKTRVFIKQDGIHDTARWRGRSNTHD